MSSGQPADGRRTAALGFVLPGLLVVLVIAGLLGTVSAPGWTGRYHTDGIAIGVALEMILAALFVVLLIRSRRAQPGVDVLAGKLRRALGYVIAAGLIAIPIVLLLNANLHVKPGRRRPQLPLLTPSPRTYRPTPEPTPVHHAPTHLNWLPYALLALVVLAAVIVCAVLVARHRPDGDQGPLGDAEDEPEEDLRAAVESGRTALRSLDDDRAAIIACYVAMEQSLAHAGATRTAAETPDELLARAVAAGLARGAAAAGLTALFYEARFSTHPLEAGQKAAAERFLAQIAADLERQERAEPVGGHS